MLDRDEVKNITILTLILIGIFSVLTILYLTSLELPGELYEISVHSNHFNVPLSIYRENVMFVYKSVLLQPGINTFYLPAGTYRFIIKDFNTDYSIINVDKTVTVDKNMEVKLGG